MCPSPASAGYNLTSAFDCTFIGSETAGSVVNADNQIVIGKSAVGQANDSVTLGNASVTAVYMAQDKGATVYCSDVIPSADNTNNLGAAGTRWANLYVADAHYSNVGTGGNDVDGTEGSWTIQEGDENLFLINRETGKKFKFKLEEIE